MKIRLAVVVPATGIGGSEVYVRTLLRLVDRSTFDLTVVTPPWAPLETFLGVGDEPGLTHLPVALREPGSRPRDETRLPGEIGALRPRTATARAALGVPALQVLAPSAQSALRVLTLERNRRALRRVLHSGAFDVVHVNNGGYPGSSAALAALLAAAERGVTGRSMTVHSAPKKRTLLRGLEARLDSRVRSASHTIVVPSATHARELETRLPDGVGIIVIPTGIDLPGPALSRGDARARLGLGEGTPVAGMIASFLPGKQHDVVLDALPRLQATMPDVTLLLAGTGPTLQRVVERTNAEGLTGCVRFLGAVNPAEVLPALDVLVLASSAEGVPLTILEAMSHGLPVVASAVGAVPEVVVPGENGLLVPPSDAAALGDALRSLLEIPERSRRMGDRGAELFHERHSVDRMVDRYQEMFVSLARGAPIHRR